MYGHIKQGKDIKEVWLREQEENARVEFSFIS